MSLPVELAPLDDAHSRAHVWGAALEVDPADHPPEVAAEETGSAELEPDLQRFEVSGTLVLPEAWEERVPDVLICPVGEADQRGQPVQRFGATRDAPFVYPWRGRVQGVGRYWIGASYPAASIEVTVAGDLTDVKLVLDMPTIVQCEVVDEQTGSPIERARIAYRPRNMLGYYRMAHGDEDQEEAGLYRFECMPTAGVLMCSARGFEPTQRVVSEQELGSQIRLRIELWHETRIVVKVRDGLAGKDLQWPTTASVREPVVIERAADGTPVPAWVGGSRDARLAAGDYLVRVADPPLGFRPTHPKRVTVREHETAEVTFDLVRY